MTSTCLLPALIAFGLGFAAAWWLIGSAKKDDGP